MDLKIPIIEGPVCPLPLRHDQTIVMGHGSGGGLTHDLIEQVFKPFLQNPVLDAGNDFAEISLPPNTDPGRLVVSTDGHIVYPLFFPGGDIGRLAVCGTVNDVSMSGAVPRYLTASFILEEGLSIETIEKILASMQIAAQEAGVCIVAGDTKVVEKGKADGIFISTSGFGWLSAGCHIRGDLARPGDKVLISGTLGDHGIAVLAARGDLGFSTNVRSDVCPLNHLIHAILESAPHTHVLRDPTRGGLATTLNEIAQQSHCAIILDEMTIPVKPAVQAVCEMLGFDPLYVANEGKVIVITPPEEAESALQTMRQHPYGKDAALIGTVEAAPAGRVLMHTEIGGTRVLDVLAGEMLPRIC